VAERDAMLATKDAAWSERLNRIVPGISVVIVNFNGVHFLANLLMSIEEQTVPPSEIIVVDNASSDGSADYLRVNFPKVMIVESQKNLGFAGGNNLGVKAATCPLIALINNDTVVDPQWLEFMLESWLSRMARGERVGAISPKIRFLRKFLNFKFTSDVFSPGCGDGRLLGFAIDFGETHIAGCDYLKPIVVSGIHGEEQWPEGRVVRWTNGEATTMLPVPVDISSIVLRLVAAAGGKPGGVDVKVFCEGILIGNCHFGEGFTIAELTLPQTIYEQAGWVINNAGSNLDGLGNAGDVGINQRDDGQFDTPVLLDAFCGCSVLFGRECFMAMGGFDDRLFMYYEDSDLSWRMRRAGLLIAFEPRAVVRHMHAGSSVEWSPGFRYHVVRNQRLIGLKNARWNYLPLLGASLAYAAVRNFMIHGLRGYRMCLTTPITHLSPEQIECKAIHDAFVLAPRFLGARPFEIIHKK